MRWGRRRAAEHGRHGALEVCDAFASSSLYHPLPVHPRRVPLGAPGIATDKRKRVLEVRLPLVFVVGFSPLLSIHARRIVLGNRFPFGAVVVVLTLVLVAVHAPVPFPILAESASVLAWRL